MEVIGVEGAKELGLEVSEESRLLCTMKAEPEGRGMTSPCPEDSEGGVMWLFTAPHSAGAWLTLPAP